MQFRLSYIILFLFITANIYCQDIIVKKDSTKIICRIFEINSTFIKYIELKDTYVHKQKIDKNEVLKLIFRNRDEIRYNDPLGKHSTDTLITLKIKERINVKPVKKLHDWVKFNLTTGVAIYESDVNRPGDNDTAGTHGATRFSYSRANKQYKTSFNPGFNFILGGSPYIKHIFGVNYVQLNGEFNYRKVLLNPDSTDNYNKTSITSLNIKSTDHYLNIVNGFRITLFKSLHIETCITINIPTINRSRINGNTITHETGKPDTYYSIKDSTSTRSYTKLSYAFNPRISYEFKKNGQRFGVYAAYTINSSYKISWLACGISYYPFKKLR